MNLRSVQTKEFLEESVVNEFLMAESMCAIAADSKFSHTVWLVRLHSKQQEATAYITDSYGHNQDKHTYVSHTMRSKKQPEIRRST